MSLMPDKGGEYPARRAVTLPRHTKILWEQRYKDKVFVASWKNQLHESPTLQINMFTLHEYVRFTSYNLY